MSSHHNSNQPRRKYSSYDTSNDDENMINQPKIGVFGASSWTGQYFVKLALDARYHIQALHVSDQHSTHQSTMDHPDLQYVYADSYYDKEALLSVVQNVDYCVCLLNDVDLGGYSDGSSNNKKQADRPTSTFLETLYPIMLKERHLKVFLFQANSLVADIRGKTPVLSKVLKTANNLGSSASNLLSSSRSDPTKPPPPKTNYPDLDRAMQVLSWFHRGKSNLKEHQQLKATRRPSFAYIVIRPSLLLTDAPSSKKLLPSKSQPGPLMKTSHVDLAEFALNCLLQRKLYNTCPYAVSDSF